MEGDANEIVLKYFEPGHTFMSADSVHHSIEQKQRDAKNVFHYDNLREKILETRAEAKCLNFGLFGME